MKPAPTALLATAYRAACHLDVASFKPGNVSLMSPGHGMRAADFLRSAEHSAAPLTIPAASLGERILGAIVATREVVGCNTNLGIVLLIAPIVQAVHTGGRFRAALARVLETTTLDDARAAYAAIRVAAPGGLGRASRHDVADAPAVILTEAMGAAAGVDLVARQYVNGFHDVLDVAAPYLAGAEMRHGDPALALTDLYLYLLARYPDSHVTRKHGSALAGEVSGRAGAVHRAMLAGDAAGRRDATLQAFDRSLKRRAINPGTTADLCVATSFIHRLQQQAVIHTGSTPDHPRQPRPDRAGVPLFLKSQVSEGDKKWQ